MLHSKRFWIAFILVIIALCCMVYRVASRKDAADQTEQLPAYSSVTATVSSTTTVTILTTTSVTSISATSTQPKPEPSASDPFLPEWKLSELKEKAVELADELSGFVGWIYVADSEIDYPVMQGEDNQFYLHHAPNGSYYECGSIFLDSNCDRALTGDVNILYGHNMVSGMFGDIRSFRSQDKFDSHRYGWLITADKVWRIDFFALAVADAYDVLYDVASDGEEWITRLKETSEFFSDIAIDADDRFIALSTCTYGSENARALFTGRLTLADK